MSEYWKSTPKYWCKHCKTYVRDSKLEKSQHEATPKHQGNLKRFLRDLHRGHEREERDKQRAKNEVERLNGVVAGSPSGTSSSDPPWKRKLSNPPATSANKQVSVAERKQQLTQLAEMGVAIPEEFRREMAMAGDWQTLSERLIEPAVKKEEEDMKPDVHSIGIRKRKHPGQEEEEEAGETIVRKGWGSRIKTHPGQSSDDLDALLGGRHTIKPGAEASTSSAEGPGTGFPAVGISTTTSTSSEILKEGPLIKREDSDGNALALTALPAEGVTIKAEDGEGEGLTEAPVVFKKRKAKNIRQRG